MFLTSLLREPNCSITTPTNSSGTSMVSSSTGSMSLPSTRLVTISGLPTMSSKPSRRIISRRIESCNSPRPSTLKESVLPVSSTRSETLVRSSFARRSRRLREVTYCPSRPAKGEVLMVNSIPIVGSSMTIGGSGAGFSTSVMVSPMVIPSTPATAMMSPISVSVQSVRFRPENENSLVILVLWNVPSSFAMATSSPVNMVPLKTRAMAMRPR